MSAVEVTPTVTVDRAVVERSSTWGAVYSLVSAVAALTDHAAIEGIDYDLRDITGAERDRWVEEVGGHLLDIQHWTSRQIAHLDAVNN